VLKEKLSLLSQASSLTSYSRPPRSALCTQSYRSSVKGRHLHPIPVHPSQHCVLKVNAPINRGGRRRQHTSSAAEQQIQQFTRIVRCQRAFNQRPGSYYIRVQTLGAEAIPEADSLAISDHNSQVIDQMERAYTEREELPQVIVASQRDETNPWLRRTQWAVYLQGINPHDLVGCVRAPDPESLDQTEQAAYAIWNSMAAVARISQLICTKRATLFGARLFGLSGIACHINHYKHIWMVIMLSDTRSHGSRFSCFSRARRPHMIRLAPTTGFPNASERHGPHYRD
jgi:hypothetical protein